MTETEGKVTATGVAGKPEGTFKKAEPLDISTLISSEAVSMGHPDKIADQIAAMIATEIIKLDPEARTAIEVAGSGKHVYIFGETSIIQSEDAKGSAPDQRKTLSLDEFKKLAGGAFVHVLQNIGGYSKEDIISYDLQINVQPQSVDIADKVANSDGTIKGAGDQGMMYGYASDETEEMMPYAYSLARKFIKKLEDVRLAGEMEELGPDAKVMVTVDKAKGNRLVDLVISTQTLVPVMETAPSDFRNEVLAKVVIPVLYEDKVNMRRSQNSGEVLTTKHGDPILKDYMRDVLLNNFHLNEGGDFISGGFTADAGLTGRKIIYDTYGGLGHHGGGAFCVDGETEYMSSLGVWKKIKDYDGAKVAQWNNGTIEFVNPLKYHKTQAEKMYHFKSDNNIDMVLSEHHNMVYKTSKGNLNKKSVAEVLEQHFNSETGFKGSIPAYFDFAGAEGLNWTDDEIRLQIAFSAEGNLKASRIRIKKDYKIKQLEHLLKVTDTEYRKSVSEDGFNYYYFTPKVQSKSLYDVFKGANKDQFKVIAEEVMLWDGSAKEKVFRTTHKQDADFIQTVFSIVYGTQSSILVDDRVGETFGSLGAEYTRKSICYSVYHKANKYVGLKRKSTTGNKVTIDEVKEDMMYCFTVPTGMLLLRRNDRIFVTGNCGKDGSKVDVSGAYMARYMAKNLLKVLKDGGHREVHDVNVQLSYGIGQANPMAVTIWGDGLDTDLAYRYGKAFEEKMTLTPEGIIDLFDLRHFDFTQVAHGGHFGRTDIDLPWEQLLN